MTKNRRASGLVALAAAGALLLAACGGSGNGNGNSASGSPSGAAPAYNAALTGVVNPSTVKGGTLKLGNDADCDSYDPQRTYYGYCWNLQRLFTRTLMGFAPKPGVPEIIPDMAVGKPTVNADKTDWTFELKPNIKFQDGSVVTTADIKYGIERMWATDVIIGGPGGYYLCLLDTCAADGTPTWKGPYADPTGSLSTIITPDATHIEFKLNKPFSDFAFLMALPAAAPVQKSKDTKGNYQQVVQSTGPYMIQSFEAGKQTTWVRNPMWDQSTDDIRHPLVDKVTMQIVSDDADLDKRITSGALDANASDAGISLPSNYPAILANPTSKASVDNGPDGATSYLPVFSKITPLENKACREAIFYALDKASLLKIAGGDTAGVIATGMTPPVIAGFEKDYNPYPSGADGKGDVDKAKQKLTECGQPNGFDLVYTFRTTGVGPQSAAAVQASLARAGIRVKLVPAADPSVYYQTWIGSPASIKAHNIGLASAGWGADYPSPYGFFNNIVASTSPPTSNYNQINDPTVDGVLTQLTKADLTDFQKLGADLNHAVMDTAMLIPTRWSSNFLWRSARMTNAYCQGSFFNVYDWVNVGTGGQ